MGSVVENSEAEAVFVSVPDSRFRDFLEEEDFFLPTADESESVRREPRMSAMSPVEGGLTTKLGIKPV